MELALREGDWVIVDEGAYRRRAPRVGDVVVAADPREPWRVVMKRVKRVEADGRLWLEGDNPAESTDSRVFGSVAASTVIGRVRWRYWPRPGRVR